MSRIKIEDLPLLEELDPNAAKGLFGGSGKEYQFYSISLENASIAAGSSDDGATTDGSEEFEDHVGAYNFRLEIAG